MRCRGPRLARATVRGLLLLGGAIATWGAYDTFADDAAQAAAEPQPSIVGDLLGGTGAVVDSLLAPPSAPPAPAATVAPRPARPEPVRQPAAKSTKPADARPPARVKPHPVVRVPRVDLSPATAPAGRTVDAAAGPGLTKVVDAVARVPRPVVDAATPVLREVTRNELLAPVDAVVRPVAEPILQTLDPVLAPVLEVTRPILGPPADPVDPLDPVDPVDPVIPPGDPVVPPGDPVVPPPGPPAAVPTTTVPGATANPVRAAVLDPTRAVSSPATPHRTAAERQFGGDRADVDAAADVDTGPVHVAGVGVLAAGSAGSATSSAAAGHGAAADISPRPWMPELTSGRCVPSRCDAYAQRSPQPGTRPA
ncbi:hypothetical protein [Micromonospora sp. CPCC 205556]|uniref:hypothetical protein n=1 Tax=Micromonospora sp. CPCC 205556 TaxID=3122398 RepID=UPI002FEFA7C7